jgi:nitroimidazol reductase NimA-like FMN-containing flavoprotein (pyridoxamine 5'-phosphate oxidase superfamily)
MENVEQAKKHLQELLRSQKLAVLSTNRQDHPYASLVGFAATDDVKHLIFATARSTRKYANLTNNAKVAMLIDSRSNQDADFHAAIAATAIGTAEEIGEHERETMLELYLTKHPHLMDFVKAPTCALIRMKVDCYYLVSRFQNVIELHVT